LVTGVGNRKRVCQTEKGDLKALEMLELEARALELLAEIGSENSELKERAAQVSSVTSADNQRPQIKGVESGS
jgi:hypothetical protein